MVRTLLVADDSPTIQKVVRLALAGEDIQIESVDRADEVVEKSISTNADLVLVDVSMPGMTGYQICERLKAESSMQRPGVVLLVGTGDHLDESEAARVGCDGYLSKPFETYELLRTVRRLLGLETQGNQPTELVSARARESFLGSGSVLDVFGSIIVPREPRLPEPEPEQVASASVERTPEVSAAAPAPGTTAPHVIPFPLPKSSEAQAAAPVELPDEILDAIAQRVIRQMSPEIIREVAWEVIPDLAEIAIRQYLEEHGVGR